MSRQKQDLFFGGDLIHAIFIKDSFILQLRGVQ